MAEITVHYDGPIVTRAEAKARGLKRYFTGKICIRRHLSERETSSGGCLACCRARHREAHPPGPRAPRIAKEKSVICVDCGCQVPYTWAKPKRCSNCRTTRAEKLRKEKWAEIKGNPEALASQRAVNYSASVNYKKRNPEKRRASASAWMRRNMDAAIARRNERYNTDPVFNMITKVRRRIYMALRGAFKGKRKTHKTIELLGCSYVEFVRHVTRQFTKGMTLEKCFSGEIVLDHIVPCAAFDLTDPEQQRVCFHFTNMRPMWKRDNLEKSGKRLTIL